MLVPHSVINNWLFFIYFNGSLSFLFFDYNFIFRYLYIFKFVPRSEVMISLISCTAIRGRESGCQGFMCLRIGVQWEIRSLIVCGPSVHGQILSIKGQELSTRIDQSLYL